MTSPASHGMPMLVESLGALREKYENRSGFVKELWDSLLWMAEHRSDEVPKQYARHWPVNDEVRDDTLGNYFNMLAYLVTHRTKYARAGRKVILHLAKCLPQREACNEVQMHTWCAMAPLARYAVYYDWIADSGVFSPQEHARVRDALVGLTFDHAYTRLRGRCSRASSNQTAAMVMACLFVGHLFGSKRDCDVRAQQMKELALARLPHHIGGVPAGGYAWEGSTYVAHVTNPCLALLIAFMEWWTGADFFWREYAPNGNRGFDVLRWSHKMILPSGHYVPWDNGSFYPPRVGMVASLLARKTDDPQYLAALKRYGSLLDQSMLVLWDNDPLIWTLVWWPDDLNDVPAFSPACWAEREVAGTVGHSGVHVFQMWDRCQSVPGRENVNPNSVIVTAFGSPITVDGDADPDCKEFQKDVYKGWDNDAKAERNWGAATTSAHSCVLLDNELDYFPDHPACGKLVDEGRLPSLEFVTADVTDFYKPHYDVTSVVRTSCVTRDYLLVYDKIQAETEHDVTLRFQLRPQATSLKKGFRVITQEQVQCDVVPEAECSQSLSDVPGRITYLDARAQVADFTYRAQNPEIATLFHPHDLKAERIDLSDDWRFTLTSWGQLEEDKLWSADCDDSEWPTVGIGKHWLHFGEDGSGVGLYRRPIVLPEEWEGKRNVLVLGRTTRDLVLWVNGLRLPMKPPKGIEPVIELTDLLTAGSTNTLAVAVETPIPDAFYGPAYVARLRDPLDCGLTRQGELLIVRAGDREDVVLPPRVEPITIETEASKLVARAAWTAPHARAFYALTELNSGGTRIESSQPIDIEMAANRIRFGAVPDAWYFELYAPEGALTIGHDQALRVRATGGLAGWELVFPVEAGLMCEINGVSLPGQLDEQRQLVAYRVPYPGPSDGDRSRFLALTESRDEARRSEGILGLGSFPEAYDEVLRFLDDNSWRVQMVAAQSLGRMGNRNAVRPLLRLLDSEDKERQSYEEGDANWWRVRSEAILALGLLGDRKAVPRLGKYIGSQEFYPLRARAAHAIGRLGGSKARALLEAAAQDSEANTRMEAELALAKLPRDEGEST